MLRKIITKRKDAIKHSPDGQVNDDLLGLLLQSNQLESIMSTEDVINECKVFYFAGQDTTSILLTWTMVVLGMNPDWQDRARAEVLQVFGSEKPDFERLSRLKIVTMILYEVLRLYPSVVHISRRTKAATKVGEYNLPAGVGLELSILLLQHDPDYWGEDAMEFNPERFSEGVSKGVIITSYPNPRPRDLPQPFKKLVRSTQLLTWQIRTPAWPPHHQMKKSKSPRQQMKNLFSSVTG